MNHAVASIYVYDVDGEGGCCMHYAALRDDGQVAVSVGVSQYPNGFFKSQLSMHQALKRDAVLMVDNEDGQVWMVSYGKGDFYALMALIATAQIDLLNAAERGNNGKGIDFTSPFARN